MAPNRRLFLRLAVAGLLCLASRFAYSTESVDAWLCNHPDLAAKIVWEFPPSNEASPISNDIPGKIRSLPSWSKPASALGVSVTAFAATPIVSSPPNCCAGNACPIPPNFLSTGARALPWLYWDDVSKGKLRQYFNQSAAWLSAAWPLYQQYRDGGFSQKPAGFADMFEPAVDPDVQGGQDLLPIVVTVMKDSYTHVLYDSNAAFDLYLKNLGFQLALETGGYLPWTLAEDADLDQAVTLNGQALFHYFPAGSRPWGGAQTVDHGGHDATGAFPAPPRTTFRFLVREGILRGTRFETVSRWLEWERFNLRHVMGTPQDLTGECGKEYHEDIWGVKGAQPVSRILLGWPMACPLVPTPGSGANSFFDPEPRHWTGGCGTTGFVNHRVLRQVNIPAEWLAFTHSQTRFVVEASPYRQMRNALEPLLPAEPALDDGLPAAAFSLGDVPVGKSVLVADRRARGPKLDRWENVYLDHNDNPYGLVAYTDIPVKEALISEDTYLRWFKKPPDNLSDEQDAQYMQAHGKYVSLRPAQLEIYHLPQHLLSYYCHYDEGRGKPHEDTKTFGLFSYVYTAAELEGLDFWSRLEQKIADAGGCGQIPPLF